MTHLRGLVCLLDEEPEQYWTRQMGDAPACINEAQHALQPRGYAAWHSWAAGMLKTHNQRQCDGCGRWAIWAPKDAA